MTLPQPAHPSSRKSTISATSAMAGMPCVMMPHFITKAAAIMQNSNDWQVTLAGLALAVAALGKEHEPNEGPCTANLYLCV